MSATENAQPSPQAQASDPRNSAWVSANAGSGKTTVLVWRVIRLLLDGVPPGRILCLTYTKAAAAHMANEVLKTLSAWVRLDDEALDAEIARIESTAPSPGRRARARRLFASALETPGGLKVQTIHAFCDRVLHMFPVEAQTPAGFEVLDELGERNLLETARLQVLTDAGRKPESALGKSLAHCIEIAGDETIEQVIGEAVKARQHLDGFDFAASRRAMLAALGLSESDSPDTIAREILEDGGIPRREWQGCGEALLAIEGNAAKIGAALIEAARTPSVDYYLSVFLTADGKPKADTTFGKKSDLAKIERIRDWLFAERIRLAGLRDKLQAVNEVERSCALFTIASEVVARYRQAKERRGVLDFADLVTRTVALLEREESAWVHFKLDGGIDHILVDEAQDTSPEQWRIVAKLAEEFFAGKGASERRRTIFAVGDEKQSIFGFQGADPVRFEEMREHFSRQVTASGGALSKPRLLNSYRSVDAVLKAVDKVFLPQDARKGLSASDDAEPVHVAVRKKAPGMVEIWPAIPAIKESGEDDGWDKPLDRMRENSAQMRLARQIADAVKVWINGGLSVGDRRNSDRPRAVTPGDIIVLVQRRGTLFDAILRALKQAGVPVAGADRLVLTENIAVMDLLALGDALLLAEDDLSLACVLKSPLFGFGDEDLFTLCFDRSGTLAESLAGAADAKYAEAARTLAHWRESAMHLRPFDFYSRVLGRDGGRKKMVARLGPEAADALDEFLAAALSYESAETPSLHGFLSFLRRANSEVKRDLEAEGTSVRVMTVHGVKGLEAPVIVLADTTTLPPKQKESRLVALGSDENAPLIWVGSKEETSQALLKGRDRARGLREQEYRRLLYVALTRAADVLVVCGALNKNQKDGLAEQGSWYDLVHSALAEDGSLSTKHKVPYSKDEVTRWRTPAFPPLAMEHAKQPPVPEQAPAWLAQGVSETSASFVRLRPSYLSRDAVRDGSQTGGGRTRGVLLHRLLQSLPELPREEREPAALRYLAQSAPELNDTAREKLAREALLVIEHPDCALLFSPQSRAEPELLARIREGGGEIEIPARLDRLVVNATNIVFGDFKSDMAVPGSLAEIPAHYLSQLAAYRAALAQAFPGREMTALLVYTAAPCTFEIPRESLDSAWRRLKTQTSPALS
ncbi:MAG: double-strand break repair helicase AddA [Rhizobiales bacterium]|nr:double-strand break repair helicase AddA [Hyphomicrobiales bacterium]